MRHQRPKSSETANNFGVTTFRIKNSSKGLLERRRTWHKIGPEEDISSNGCIGVQKFGGANAVQIGTPL